MVEVKNSNELTAFLSGFFQTSQRPVCFAGAGVSSAAGLPVWESYLRMLAEAVRPYDPIIRQAMLERIAERNLTNAAELFFICPKLTNQIRYEALTCPLADFDIEPIKHLCALPFHGWVTTNYDRVLLDCYANMNGKAALESNYPEKSLASAIFEKDQFIARINGHVEDPRSIVLSDSQFKELDRDPIFNDFLVNLFSRSQILFVGFSFADPAITNVLRIVEERFPVVHEGKHFALLPDSDAQDLPGRLEKLGVTPLYYESGSNHIVLWESLRAVLGQSAIELTEPSFVGTPLSHARKYLAASFARLRMGRTLTPLRQIVFQGLVASVVRDWGSQGVSEPNLVMSCQELIHLREEDLRRWVYTALSELETERLIERIDNETGQFLYHWTGSNDDPLLEAVNVLCTGVLDRLFVREGVQAHPAVTSSLRKFLEQLFVTRGWDLGVALAARGQLPELDIHHEIEAFADFSDVDAQQLQGLERAVLDLVRRPDSIETEVLADMGRLSFTIELALGSPNQTFSGAYTLPQRLYLDANVLLPAITHGHPYNKIYEATIDRLVESSVGSGSGVEVVAIQPFLNEVVSHRQVAIREVEEIGGDQLDDALKKETWLLGTKNLNVFLAGYSNYVRTLPKKSFNDYLAEYAPYENENQLERWLKKKGVKVMHEGEVRDHVEQLPEILDRLERAYANRDKWRNKTATLIQHDALQLALLEGDRNSGVRSVFVSMDMQLRAKLEEENLGHLTDHMLSSLELVQLVDLLLGCVPDKRGFSELMWAAPVTSRSERLRDYFIDLGLNEYDQAIAKKLPQLVDEIAEDAAFALEEEIDRGRGDPTQNTREYLKFMEAFEDRFFRKMREEIEKRED